MSLNKTSALHLLATIIDSIIHFPKAKLRHRRENNSKSENKKIITLLVYFPSTQQL